MDHTKGLRMPTELYKAIELAAQQDERDYSSELRYLIRRGLEIRANERRILQGYADCSIQAQELAGFMAGGQVQG